MKLLPLICLTAMLGLIACDHTRTLPKPPPDPRAKQLWGDNLEIAKAQAAKNNKLVFVDFTGSDWCRPAWPCTTMCSRKKSFSISREKPRVGFIDFPKTNLLTKK